MDTPPLKHEHVMRLEVKFELVVFGSVRSSMMSVVGDPLRIHVRGAPSQSRRHSSGAPDVEAAALAGFDELISGGDYGEHRLAADTDSGHSRGSRNRYFGGAQCARQH